MFLRFCSKSVYARINTREACRGSSVILAMALAGGVIAGLAMLVLHLSATL